MEPCRKCGSTDYYIEADSRGVASAFCSDCNTFIKKMSTLEVMQYYQDKEAHEDDDKPMCKYCNEDWGYRIGRLGQAFRIMNDTKYCPMCGRKRKPTDRDY